MATITTPAVVTPPGSEERSRPGTGHPDGRRIDAQHSVMIGVVVVGAVLRVWQATTHGLTFDETFTAMTARLPIDRLFEHLRVTDSHPPLDYLLRAPFAAAGASDLWVRMPSLVFSVGALVLFARWMRPRGRAGLVAVTCFALSPFLILHGAEARMYALLQLLGVAAAMLAESRVRTPARWQLWAVAALVAAACLDHVSGLLLAVGLFAVAGVGRSRAAWAWRGAVTGGVAVWALLWGPVFLRQAGHDWSGWIPRTSVSAVVRVVGGQVTNVTAVRLLVVVAVVGGGVLLFRGDRTFARVWLTVGVVPFAVAAAIGFFSPFLIDRSLTVAAWAAPVALGVLADAAIRRGGRLVAVFLALALVFLGLGAVAAVAGADDDADRAVDHLEEVVRPGDAVATLPARMVTLPAYRIGVEEMSRPRSVEVPAITRAAAFRDTAAPATGRIWLFSPGAFAAAHYAGYERCAGTDTWRRGAMTIDCFDPVGTGAAKSSG